MHDIVDTAVAAGTFKTLAAAVTAAAADAAPAGASAAFSAALHAALLAPRHDARY